MTAALLAHADEYAIAALLFLAAHLCGRLERWHTRRAAAIAQQAAAHPLTLPTTHPTPEGRP